MHAEGKMSTHELRERKTGSAVPSSVSLLTHQFKHSHEQNNFLNSALLISVRSNHAIVTMLVGSEEGAEGV